VGDRHTVDGYRHSLAEQLLSLSSYGAFVYALHSADIEAQTIASVQKSFLVLLCMMWLCMVGLARVGLAT